MARFYSRKRWNRSGRYYGRNYGYKRSRKGYGQYKAAKQQADNAKVIINIPSQISCFNKRVNLGTEQEPKLIECGIYALNVYDLMRKSEFYQSYSKMYDEFKIDNVKIKLIPSSFNISQGTNGNYQSLTVYTAWDRTGLSQEQLLFHATAATATSEYIGTTSDLDGLYTNIGSNITTYSSSESKQVHPGTNTTITRWLKPKTINEKAAWLSTSVIDQWCTGWDSAHGRYYGIPTRGNLDEAILAQLAPAGGTGSVVNLISISPAIKENPCFLVETPDIKFKPTLLVGVYPSINDEIDPSALPSENKILFNLEADIDVTFRGLRKAQIV